MTTYWSRRDLIHAGVAIATTTLTRGIRAQAGAVNPHFFLQVVMPGGMDNLYTFDSRPLAFKAAGRVANYASTDPTLWEGAAGGRCLASSFTDIIKPYKSRLAIVNGVHMSPGFEGHEQNVNSLLSANPFGGKYYGPILAPSGRPLDFVSIGALFGANISNKERSLAMPASIAPSLAAKAAQIGGATGTGAPWKQWVSARAENCGVGGGMVSTGCRAFRDSLLESQPLALKLGKTSTEFGADDSAILKGAKVAFKYFTEGVADVFLVAADDSFDFDTHSEDDAAKSPEIFNKFTKDLAALFDALVKTPFNVKDGLSMLDVTTVMISSEFGRTHGQNGRPADKTGTDHNPQSNMVLLAGKGIKGDLVIGASDLDTIGVDNAFTDVSDAHKSLDSNLLKKMGKPYNFDTGEISTDLPAEYKIGNYISIASVINTVLSGFGVSENDWMTNDPSRRGGDIAPAKILSKLLS
jgi:uncharacterized protein (DUF1501 family)